MLTGMTGIAGFAGSLRSPPTVVDRTISFNNTSGTTRNVTLPGSLVSDDLLVMCISSHRADTAFTAPSGWTQLFNQLVGSGSTGITLACFYKVSNGAEGASVAVPSTGMGRAAAIVYRFRDYSDTPEASTPATGTGGMPNSPSLSPTWGSDGAMFLSVAGTSAPRTVNAYPANYSNGTTAVSTNSGPTSLTDIRCSGAERALNAASEDPGAYTLDANADHWVAATIAVLGK